MKLSVTTDEVVNTFFTPWGHHRQANAHVHHLPRSKLNTWTQAERADVVTANGPIHLRGYAFQLKAFGQNEACEWVWRPSENGWQKRISVAVCPNKIPMDEDANADFSAGIWQGLHNWMWSGPSLRHEYYYLDPYALGVTPSNYTAPVRSVTCFLLGGGHPLWPNAVHVCMGFMCQVSPEVARPSRALNKAQR